LPGKNIIDLAGKPLIAYSILAARYSKLVSRVIVSTENETIAHIAKEWGAEVPFLRPRAMAGDESIVSDAISYTISRLGGQTGDRVFAVLFPTSPFRSPGFIDQMLEILLSGYRSIATVKPVTIDPQFTYITNQNNKNELINIYGENNKQSIHRQFFRPYATFYANMPTNKDRHYYHVLTDKCMLIDIDTSQDLKWAETIIQKKIFDFGF
jgi:N-acylneuraminate cytidylyltransferase